MSCCIVGGGPAGMVLGYLLARKGIEVTLLEAQKDFDRDFRGDSISPSVMEIMDDLSLTERLLKLRHKKVPRLVYRTPGGCWTVTDFTRLKTRHPYLTLIPQADFLEFLAHEAERFPNFRLIMGANVTDVIEEGGRIHGVRYRKDHSEAEMRSPLLIAADGRNSRIRRSAGLVEIRASPPIDLLCFRVPRLPADPEDDDLSVYAGSGYYMGLWDRFEYWQINYLIPKGSYPELRAEGIARFRKAIGGIIPHFEDRLRTLEDWSQVSFLSVAASRLKRWYRPGLLLIGDAAHVMSPAGGVGINCAIQDAVAAAGILLEPLRKGSLTTGDLASVQRKREWPIRILQKLQSAAQKRLISAALDSSKTFRMPFSLKIRWFQDLAARMTAIGPWRVPLNKELL